MTIVCVVLLIALGVVIYLWRSDMHKMMGHIMEKEGQTKLWGNAEPVKINYVDEERELDLETKPSKVHYADE